MGRQARSRTGVHRFVVVFIPPRNKEEKVRKYLTEWCKNPIIKLVKSGKLSQAAVPIEKNKNKSTLLSRFRSRQLDGKERPV